ncbi:hypothetical protein QJV14_09795 [Listeria cossartiae subsp. cayugensis]|nr:hypothetical protein [Listeria cossartiae]MDT0004261.1 hypothetical protein [Listeria cossartiae subsp. cayugensis]MDT0020655.1 hypothetical protein [Listeria cossartiae subsp. cayugensis]MDT0036130.1 hypothetical protein [Listeria cossartiae subsp. cayugensis]MDT0042406.1 hypothetical protein [Listeria cossartiae subsp. cayugensis]MDT0047757.1 hypothetical protein [Listeria cossartiae subsp. cayugensis]
MDKGKKQISLAMYFTHLTFMVEWILSLLHNKIQSFYTLEAEGEHS